MKSITALFLFLALGLATSSLKAQTPTNIDLLSFSGAGAEGVTFSYRVTDLTGASVTSGGVEIRLCQDMSGSICFDFCGGNLNAGGQGSCTMDVNVSPGQYWLFVDYGGTTQYAPSEFRRTVVGDGGGGIS
jgi:hypothetical protein